MKFLNKKVGIIVFVCAVLLLVLVGVNGMDAFQEKLGIQSKREEIHIHAGFKIYNENELLDFSDEKHMYLSPCGGGVEGELFVEDTIHLHNNVGDVAHIHYEGVIWQDLLDSLGVDYKGKNIELFSSSFENEIDLEDEVKPLESVILFIESDVDTLEEFISEEHILEVEQQSENCGSEHEE